MNTAVRILAGRDHTRYEIRQKLKQRGFSPGAIRAAVAECERLNYIDDERTARIYIGQLVRRGFGFRRIAIELRKKGLQGRRFEDKTWQRWQELGRLAHILRLGFVIAWLATQAQTKEEQTNWKRIVYGYNDPVRAGLKWI